jgi:hypothetical protein
VDPANNVERWFYCGQRLLNDDKLYHAWQTPDGNMRFFAKLHGNVIGAEYDVEVVNDKSVRPDPKWIAGTTHPDTAPWRVTDSADRVRHATQQREAKAKRDSRDLGDMTLAALATQYQKLVGPQRTALLAQIIQRLQRGTP